MLYKNNTEKTIEIGSIAAWSLYQTSIGPSAVVDIPDDKMDDGEIRRAIRTGVLIPVPGKPRTKVAWCPYDGSHSHGRGTIHETIVPCKHCSMPMGSHGYYCQTCFVCRTCDRVIKRRFKA